MSDVHQEQSLTPVKTSIRERFFYGLGDGGYNFLFEMGQLYLLKYYTDHLGIPAYIAGLIFLGVKVWDAFVDISVGTWIDNRTNIGPKGKFRPFMLYSAIPLALIFVASFSIPDFTLTWKIVLATVTYMVFGTIYSMGNIAYGSMIPALTKNLEERSILASCRQAGSNFGLLASTMLFMPMIWIFDATTAGYTITTSIFAVIGVIFIYLSYANIHENYVVKPAEKVNFESLKKSYKALLKNKALIVLCILNVFTFSAFNVKLSIQIYFAEYGLHDTTSIMYMGFFSMGAVFVGTIVVPMLVKKIDKVFVYAIGGAIWGISDILAFFVVDSTLLFVIFATLAFFGSSFINTLNWALISDAVEYGHWKTGIRSEGLVYSSYTFFRKLSTAIAGFVPGVVLTLVGYIPNQEQTYEAMLGIKGLIFIYPSVLSLITMVTILWFYPIRTELYNKIIKELNARKTNN